MKGKQIRFFIDLNCYQGIVGNDALNEAGILLTQVLCLNTVGRAHDDIRQNEGQPKRNTIFPWHELSEITILS